MDVPRTLKLCALTNIIVTFLWLVIAINQNTPFPLVMTATWSIVTALNVGAYQHTRKDNQ